MMVDIEQAFFQHQGIVWLWFGMLAPPLAFLLNLQLSYVLVPQACVMGQHLLLHLVPVGTVLLAVGGGVSAWYNWRRTGHTWSTEAAGVLPRSRFMAATGLLISGLFILAIVAQWLPNFLLNPCQR
jgi:hypothetical protein